MLSPDDLLTVARAYQSATGYSLVTIGRRSCNNDKIYKRIAEGGGALSLSIERAGAWFAANWPANTEWPAGIERPPGTPRRPRGTPAPNCAA
jgi:hypothetical protein